MGCVSVQGREERGKENGQVDCSLTVEGPGRHAAKLDFPTIIWSPNIFNREGKIIKDRFYSDGSKDNGIISISFKTATEAAKRQLYLS